MFASFNFGLDYLGTKCDFGKLMELCDYRTSVYCTSINVLERHIDVIVHHRKHNESLSLDDFENFLSVLKSCMFASGLNPKTRLNDIVVKNELPF